MPAGLRVFPRPAQKLVKPPPGWSLNRRSRWASMLTAAWIFNEGCGATVRDHVTDVGTYDLTIPANFTWQNQFHGPCLLRDATANTNALTAANAIAFTTTASLASRFMMPSLPGGGGGALWFPSPNSSPIIYISSTGKISVYNLGDHFFNVTLAAGVWYDLLFSSNAGSITLIVNGVVDSATISTSIANSYKRIGSEDGSGAMNAYFDYFFPFAGLALSLPDMIELAADPYGMFQPDRVVTSMSGSSGKLLRRRREMALV